MDLYGRAVVGADVGANLMFWDRNKHVGLNCGVVDCPAFVSPVSIGGVPLMHPFLCSAHGVIFVMGGAGAHFVKGGWVVIPPAVKEGQPPGPAEGRRADS